MTLDRASARRRGLVGGSGSVSSRVRCRAARAAASSPVRAAALAARVASMVSLKMSAAGGSAWLASRRASSMRPASTSASTAFDRIPAANGPARPLAAARSTPSRATRAASSWRPTVTSDQDAFIAARAAPSSSPAARARSRARRSSSIAASWFPSPACTAPRASSARASSTGRCSARASARASSASARAAADPPAMLCWSATVDSDLRAPGGGRQGLDQRGRMQACLEGLGAPPEPEEGVGQPHVQDRAGLVLVVAAGSDRLLEPCRGGVEAPGSQRRFRSETEQLVLRLAVLQLQRALVVVVGLGKGVRGGRVRPGVDRRPSRPGARARRRPVVREHARRGPSALEAGSQGAVNTASLAWQHAGRHRLLHECMVDDAGLAAEIDQTAIDPGPKSRVELLGRQAGDGGEDVVVEGARKGPGRPAPAGCAARGRRASAG